MYNQHNDTFYYFKKNGLLLEERFIAHASKLVVISQTSMKSTD